MVHARRLQIVHCLAALQLALVVILVSGCHNNYGPVTRGADERTEIRDAHFEFSSMANKSNLPTEYVSEGKIGISKVEAALEAADTGDMQARAEMNKQVAGNNANRKEVEAFVSKTLSEAESLRKRYNREFSKAIAQITARETELNALVEQKDAILVSLDKEGQSKYNDMVAARRESTTSKWRRSNRPKRSVMRWKQRAMPTILEMTEAAKATRDRAAATVSALDARALATQKETAARVDELTQQKESLRTTKNSEIALLKTTRETLLKDSESRVKELRTKADTIRANLADQEYLFKLTKAESLKSETQAKTQEKSANAPTRLDRAMAEIGRLRADTQHNQEKAVATYDSMLAEIQAKLNDEMNEVAKIRVSADRAEQVARAEFVKAEASAIAEAARQTAVHAEAVAEAKKQEIIAQAESEANRIKQEVLDEIAAKKAAGKVEMNNWTATATPLPEDLHQVPAVPQVQPVTPRIEPDHVAAFRTAFAEVMRSRAQADAYQMVAEATFAQAKTDIGAVKAQQDAIAVEQFAIADALEAQARSRFAEIETKTAKEMDVAESKYRQNVVDAESFKKEMEAEAMDYESTALAMDQITKARAQQLLAEAETVNNCLLKDVEQLDVQLWAIQQRGDAEYAKLTTESKSVADAQEALAMQIDAQITAAGNRWKRNWRRSRSRSSPSTPSPKPIIRKR